MSEYQYVAFRAIDRPLTERELKYARSQSSRAEITEWSFTNEYHYSGFRGDPVELLRRGYDVHLHYANFGIRMVMMRLPSGHPFPNRLWSKYVDGERLRWKKDKKGAGGVLIVSPCNEPDDLEQIWEPDKYVGYVAQVRNELAGGDLRALYTAWLCGNQDSNVDSDDLAEPPVPAGIGQASPACRKLLEYFEVDPLILVAADETALPCPEIADAHEMSKRWIADLSEADARELLSRLLIDDSSTAKAETLKRMREESGLAAWPTSRSRRTLEQLRQRTQQLREKEDAREEAKRRAAAKRAAKRKERERQERMKKMVQEPKQWLKQADKLVAERGTDNYQAAAEILADLGEAIGGEEGAKVVRKHAAHLAKSHPTLNVLKSSLRKRGLLS